MTLPSQLLPARDSITVSARLVSQYGPAQAIVLAAVHEADYATTRVEGIPIRRIADRTGLTPDDVRTIVTDLMLSNDLVLLDGYLRVRAA